MLKIILKVGLFACLHPARPPLTCFSQSSWLRDALSELDSSTEKLTIIGNPLPPGNRVVRNAPPRLRLRAVGQYGSTEMDYPNDREVLETCECAQPVSFTYARFPRRSRSVADVEFGRYKFSHIARAMRALQLSLKTSLRIDNEGLLDLQFLMPTPRRPAAQRTQAFVEFWVSSCQRISQRRRLTRRSAYR